MPKNIKFLIEEINIQKTAVTPATRELYKPIENDIPCDRRLFLSVLTSLQIEWDMKFYTHSAILQQNQRIQNEIGNV